MNPSFGAMKNPLSIDKFDAEYKSLIVKTRFTVSTCTYVIVLETLSKIRAWIVFFAVASTALEMNCFPAASYSSETI